jgi:hypothetical protein
MVSVKRNCYFKIPWLVVLFYLFQPLRDLQDPIQIEKHMLITAYRIADKLQFKKVKSMICA